MKFKVGDKVRVREDLEVGKYYGAYCFISLMAEQMGKVVEIEYVYSDSYSIKKGGDYWTEEMFSGLADEPRNLIPQIAKMLGVEIGEEFKISNKPDAYKFTEDRLIGIDSNGAYSTYNTFYDLITGKEKTIKLPPRPKLSEDERVILRNLPKEYKYIARDYSGELYIYVYKPKKDGKSWWVYRLKDLSLFQHLFQFIKWEDKEPYKIQELLKGE